MITENMIFLFIIIVPILVITLFYFVFLLFKDYNQKKVMINILSNSHHQILNQEKKLVISDTTSALKKKLNFAGFSNVAAEYIFILISISFGALAGLGIYIVMQSLLVGIVLALIFSFFHF